MCTKSFHLAITDPFVAILQELTIKVANFFHHHIHALFNGAITQSTKDKIAIHKINKYINIHIENQNVQNSYQLAKISFSSVDLTALGRFISWSDKSDPALTVTIISLTFLPM